MGQPQRLAVRNSHDDRTDDAMKLEAGRLCLVGNDVRPCNVIGFKRVKRRAIGELADEERIVG